MPKQAQQTDAASYTAAWKESEDVATSLKDALARHGLLLPSVRGVEPVMGHGHVELGGARADVVARLAQVLNAAADALQSTDR